MTLIRIIDILNDIWSWYNDLYYMKMIIILLICISMRHILIKVCILSISYLYLFYRKMFYKSSSLNQSMFMNISPTKSKKSSKPKIWMNDNETATCLQCDDKFTLFKRRHHCRYCLKIFCHQCSSLLRDNKRICIKCYKKYQKIDLYKAELMAHIDQIKHDFYHQLHLKR